jgi:hypothetical protein
MTVVDPPRLAPERGRSATDSPAWRVGGSTIVLRWTAMVADLPTSGRVRVEVRLRVAG